MKTQKKSKKVSESSKIKKKKSSGVQNAGMTCNTSYGCPFCTMEGIVILSIAVAVMFLLPEKYTWISLIILFSAYLYPLIKPILMRKKNES
ncbi:MAG: hypothetical protein KKF44_09210 [Nanoarchaeota archaeon]|nr:hypothetical protein [Nanoarchaeota archaeon]